MRPDPPIFFVDRCLGSEIVPEALRKAGARVEIHSSHFAEDAADEEWLLDVGRRGWIVLTKDKHMRLRQIEREAILAARVRAFVLSTGHQQGEEIAHTLVKHLPRMEAIARQQSAPFIAAVSRWGIKIHRIRG